MAWRNGARLTGKHVKGMFRKWRRPPLPDDPRGVPRSIMKQISQEGLSSGDKQSLNLRLQQLLALEAFNKGGPSHG